MKVITTALLAGGVVLSAIPARATNLTLTLAGDEPISRKTVEFRCDSSAAELGLPPAPFTVEYVNGAGNSLAILPINGTSLIFTIAPSASGSRYASGPFIWWDAGSRGVTLYSDSLAGKKQSSCHALQAAK